MTELYLLKGPTEPEAEYEAILKLFRGLTNRELTLADKNAVRQDLGLPLLPEEGSRDTLTE